MAVLGEVGCGLGEADPATVAAFDAIEYLVDGGSLGEPFQFGDEILLQRLPLALGATLQLRVHLLGEVPDKHVWHACIMLSPATEGNPAVSPGRGSQLTDGVSRAHHPPSADPGHSHGWALSGEIDRSGRFRLWAIWGVVVDRCESEATPHTPPSLYETRGGSLATSIVANSATKVLVELARVSYRSDRP